MIPFSNSACPRLTPSSGLLISPISVSHDTNSLQREAQHYIREALYISRHTALQVIGPPQETCSLRHVRKLFQVMTPLVSGLISCGSGGNAHRRLRSPVRDFPTIHPGSSYIPCTQKERRPGWIYKDAANPHFIEQSRHPRRKRKARLTVDLKNNKLDSRENSCFCPPKQ